jgi:hypothetical protein
MATNTITPTSLLERLLDTGELSLVLPRPGVSKVRSIISAQKRNYNRRKNRKFLDDPEERRIVSDVEEIEGSDKVKLTFRLLDTDTPTVHRKREQDTLRALGVQLVEPDANTVTDNDEEEEY